MLLLSWASSIAGTPMFGCMCAAVEVMRSCTGSQMDVSMRPSSGWLRLSIPQGVRTRELTRERLVAVLPSEHQLAKRRRLHLEDLADEPFVDFPAGSSGREQSDLAFQEAGLRREVSFEVTTAELLTDLVHQGWGWR